MLWPMFSALLLLLLAAPSPEDLENWLQDVDASRHAFDETAIRARASQVVDGQVESSTDFEIYVKGRDKALIIFRDPKNNGRKVLTVGNRMWLIVPGTTNPVPITPNHGLLGGDSLGGVA